VRDAVAEMAARAQQISQEAGSKMAGALRDVILAASGMAAFAVESARDLVQYMVRRGQMTQEEADKLIREAEDANSKRKPGAKPLPPPPSRVKAAADAANAAAAAAAKSAAAAAAKAGLHAQHTPPAAPHVAHHAPPVAPAKSHAAPAKAAPAKAAPAKHASAKHAPAKHAKPAAKTHAKKAAPKKPAAKKPSAGKSARKAKKR
jgi:polyhydroxyalkanoate synthesis regulator phasin